MSDRPAEEQAVAQPSVGDKVNAIIAAAESAAQEITDKARLEAHNILRMAEQQASERITELTREAAHEKAEADQYARDMTEAADSYGTQHRRTVEEEARRLLADAETRSKEQLEAAQAKADELEQTVVQRHQTLQREAKMLEERKQRVLESLRDLAAQIQDALVEPSRGDVTEESLVHALEVEPRR
jgi:vacuolar-type H+-ATPase subunit H